jgi:hypothetical protein
MSCKKRAELLARAREAYREDDIPEAKQLLREMFGTVIRDVNKLDRHVSAVIHGMLSKKPEKPS